MMRDELTASQLQLQPLLLAWLVEVRYSHHHNIIPPGPLHADET